MERGMLFLRLAARPPLWEDAVELAEEVRELGGEHTTNRP